MEMARRRETEPKKLISFIKELRTLLPEQKAKLPPTPTSTAMPIPIFSSGRRLLQSLWMAVRSTFAKGITRLILPPASKKPIQQLRSDHRRLSRCRCHGRVEPFESRDQCLGWRRGVLWELIP
jgi:hypothetical protein